jgi:hypothetical protein
MILKKFNQFILEAYLKGGRGPIYHFTSSYNFLQILKSDILKISKPSRSTHKEKSISFTRNIDFMDARKDYCFELDVDKLIMNGYKPLPVDEIGWVSGKVKGGKSYIKSNFDSIKKGVRGTKHNLNLPKLSKNIDIFNPSSDVVTLETEFEERIYKDIEKLGKYIISIYVNYNNYDYIENIKSYLLKYPHIKVHKVIDNDFRKTKEITDVIFKKISNSI